MATPGAFLSGSDIPSFSQASFLERISADGSTAVCGTYTDTQGDVARALAVDGSGNAVVLFSNAAGTGSNLRRFSPQGSRQIYAASLAWALSGDVRQSANPLAQDAQGNSYVVLPALARFQVHNTVAPCDASGSSILAVLDANGNLLQATYMPNISAWSEPALSLGTGSSVFVAGTSSEGAELSLTALKPDANALVLPLACIGNAASLDGTAISGGELVSLYGEGLGPAAGTQPSLPVLTAYPAQLAAVEVTFNGTPGPLLYVQDGQVNAIAPWSLEGQTVNVCVTYNGSATNCLTRPVAAAVPGVFMADNTYALAFNQDGSSNTAANPAQPGTAVTIFATGLGRSARRCPTARSWVFHCRKTKRQSVCTTCSFFHVFSAQRILSEETIFGSHLTYSTPGQNSMKRPE